ncbi:hypothetical protein PR048_016442 [Dryococelus australis]|uniref:Uncharacterized protein n=1 Tax=Dryococelus australis TaxID=614101 RepID=A0ABQ9HJY0_9NEOP|nr:hypothetical protein PR048_016442 [Dryococelus australis]
MTSAHEGFMFQRTCSLCAGLSGSSDVRRFVSEAGDEIRSSIAAYPGSQQACTTSAENVILQNCSTTSYKLGTGLELHCQQTRGPGCEMLCAGIQTAGLTLSRGPTPTCHLEVTAPHVGDLQRRNAEAGKREMAEKSRQPKASFGMITTRDPARTRTRFAWVGGEWSDQYSTAVPEIPCEPARPLVWTVLLGICRPFPRTFTCDYLPCFVVTSRSRVYAKAIQPSPYRSKYARPACSSKPARGRGRGSVFVLSTVGGMPGPSWKQLPPLAGSVSTVSPFHNRCWVGLFNVRYKGTGCRTNEYPVPRPLREVFKRRSLRAIVIASISGLACNYTGQRFTHGNKIPTRPCTVKSALLLTIDISSLTTPPLQGVKSALLLSIDISSLITPPLQGVKSALLLSIDISSLTTPPLQGVKSALLLSIDISSLTTPPLQGVKSALLLSIDISSLATPPMFVLGSPAASFSFLALWILYLSTH